MVKHFKYYDNWKSEILHCPKCGWTGRFEEGAEECYRELMDSSCPVCDELLAIVSYPTIEESEANWGKLSKREKEEVKARKRFLATAKAAKLKSPAQLPDLKGKSIILTWDFVEQKPDSFTILRHEEREIWREPAFFEGFKRFEEVVRILKRKYGTRLADVIPTTASGIYLYGDSLRAPDVVEDIRKSIRESHRD